MKRIPHLDTVVIVVEYSGTTYYDSIKVIMLTIVPPNDFGVFMVIFGNNGHFGKLISHLEACLHRVKTTLTLSLSLSSYFTTHMLSFYS